MRDIGNSSKLVQALRELPENTIEGLSEYDPSSVFLKDGRIVIKSPKPFGDPLTVNFPEGSIKNVVRYGVVSFEYHERLYEIHQ